MSSRTKNIIAFSIIPQIMLVKGLGYYPELIEKYYSNGLYPVVSRFFRSLFGWIPFSIGDILYTLLALLAIRYVVLYRKEIKGSPLRFARNVLMVLSVAYFTFHFMWGLNYYREPISDRFDLARTHTKSELIDFIKRLTEKTNQVHYQITSDSATAVILPYTQKEMFNMTLVGYRNLGDKNPLFSYPLPSLKKSIYSLPLTYMGYGGYLNPFTNEAQVNGKLPAFRYPVVCAHEIGHQLGYSAENETNFIGYLVTVEHNDPYFKYSAYAYALSYSLAELQHLDERTFNELYPKLNKGIRLNYAEMNQFWTSYENPLEPVFKALFDTFLKANNQTQGIKSYHSVVSLFVNYYKDNPL